jgi:hypothetical protein
MLPSLYERQFFSQSSQMVSDFRIRVSLRMVNILARCRIGQRVNWKATRFR